LKETPELEIFSLNGQLISTFGLQDTQSEISISFLESGLYFLNINVNKQRIFTQKTIK
jgi:hypothetical protein